MCSKYPIAARVSSLATLTVMIVGLGACTDDPLGPSASHRVDIAAGVYYLLAGENVPLTVEVHRILGGEMDSTVTWRSTKPAVATVDTSGLVTAVADGTAGIIAEVGTGADTVIVTVGPPVLVGAGDIAGCNVGGDEATAWLVGSQRGLVFTAGDNAYNDGTTREYERCYNQSWGRHKHRTRPAAGNHDYHTNKAAPYYHYFGAAAGEAGKGYYSYELGGWHIVVLNSEIDVSAGSAQERWLRADLEAHPATCTLAYWHRPLFSSGGHGNNTAMRALWDALYDAGAEVVINGHDHSYERFAPQNPAGGADPERGIREFVVGTGGIAHTGFSTIRANSEIRHTGTFGVLRVELGADGYTWRFVPELGQTFTDSGSGSCH